MSDDHAKHSAIRIRLDIEIPHGASDPKVETSLERAAAAAKKPRPTIHHAINDVRVECRVPGTNQAMVYAVGTGEPDGMGGFSQRVYAMILEQGSLDPGFSIPGGAPNVPVDGANVWEFADPNLLGPVECGKVYTLYIWHEFSNGSSTREQADFTANCYGLPDCGVAAVMKKAQATPIEVLAYGWKLEAKGFAGPGVNNFNGAWELSVSQSDSGGIVIASRPRKDGVSVRLRSDERHVRWTLEFRKGGVAVRYALAAPPFQTTAKNEFSIQGARGTKPEDLLPAAITVEPA